MTPTRGAGIAGRQDIADVLVAFYSRAFADDLLSSMFVDVARMDLAAHIRVGRSLSRRLNGHSSDEPHFLTRFVAGWDPCPSAVTAEVVS